MHFGLKTESRLLQRPTMSQVSAFMLSCLFFLVVGCKVGPDYNPKVTPVPTEWHQTLDNGRIASNDQLCQWWRLFDDPHLTTLIECAADYNLDLTAAYHRITQSRAQRCIANADRFPTINRMAATTRIRQSLNGLGIGNVPGLVLDPFTLLGPSLDIAWEPDFFGRIARQVEAADANVCMSIESFRGIMVMLYGDVVQNYVMVRNLQSQLRYAKQNIERLERALDLTKKRVKGGVAPIADQYQAESTLAAAVAGVPQLEIQLHMALNRLSVLVGHYPGTLHESLADWSSIPSIESEAPIVFPCDVVRQRPDIREAERVIAARTAEIGVAVADKYPRFSFGGNVGLSAQNLGDVFSSDSIAYSFGPSFTWPLFQGGRIECGICREEAELEEALAQYEQTVLLAFEEIENAIVSYNKQKERRDALQLTVVAAEQSFEAVLRQYRAGKVEFQTVLDTLQTLFNAQTNLAMSKGDIATQLVTLYRALGGGWETDAHCEKRCTRLHCPTRVDPSVVENIPTNTDVSRYYNDGKNADNTGEKASGTDDSSSSEADGNDRTDSDGTGKPGESKNTGDLFEKQLQDLEERLKTTPNGPPKIGTRDANDLSLPKPTKPNAAEPASRGPLPEPPTVIAPDKSVGDALIRPGAAVKPKSTNSPFPIQSAPIIQPAEPVFPPTPIFLSE